MKSGRLTLLALLVGGLAGCGPSIPKSEVERLALDYGAHHCKMTVFYENPVDISAFFTAPKPVEGPIRKFLDRITQSGDYRFVSQETSDNGLRGTRYRGPDGFDFYVADAPAQSGGALYSRALISNLQGCIYLPASVDLVDLTIDKDTGKHAVAVVRWPTEEPTAFGKAILTSDLPTELDEDAFKTHPDRAYDITLEYLDQGGWHATGIAPHPGSV